MEPPYQAALVDATRRVTPGPWRDFFSRLAGAAASGGSSEGAGVIGIGMDGDPVGASVAEMMSFLPAPPPRSLPTVVAPAMPFVEDAGDSDPAAEAYAALASFIPKPPDQIFIREAITGGFPPAADNELALKVTLASGNVLALRNESTSGYSSLTARTADGHEVLAVGYGNPASAAPFTDCTYLQSWSGIFGAGVPKRFFVSMDGDYGPSGAGFRFYVRQSFETNGDVKFWRLLPSSTTQQELLHVDAVNNRVLVGYNAGNAPEQLLHLVDGAVVHDAFAANAATYLSRNAGGTASAKTQTAAGQSIISLVAQGYTDAGVYSGNLLAINGVAIEAPTAALRGSRFDFRVTPTGSVTLTTVMQLLGTSVCINIGLLTFAGVTASFPALKRSAAVLQTRLADDSAFAQFSALEFLSNRATFLMRTAVAWTNGAGVGAGTLGTAPTAGNPTKWIPVDDNGTTRHIPAW